MILIIDDQPIESTFFGEGKWLSEFITPGNLEIGNLYREITMGAISQEERIKACWQWVASKVRYKSFIKGKLQIENRVSVQHDLWCDPSIVARIRVGNCANKAFLLTSLLRNELPPDRVYCVLGNLYNGKAGGHAWTEVKLNDRNYISESTKSDVPPLVLAAKASRYEAVHYFNDQYAYAVEGRTVLVPFTACYSEWLSSYLDWSYIKSQRDGV